MTQLMPSLGVDGGEPKNPAAAPTADRVGSFSFFFDEERWEWSPELSDLHGYGMTPMRPTTEQVLSHRHPEDVQQFAAGWDLFRRDRTVFSARHRIVDTHGRVVPVLIAGGQLRDSVGQVVGTHGFYVDVSRVDVANQADDDQALADVAASRAVIEQAKGMLGVVYGITADTAFAVLRWRSQAANKKLRVLAEQLIEDFRAANTHPALPPRSVFDRLLLTGHERIGSV